MDDKNKDIDVLFRVKLGEHSEMPTPLAWEKIKGRLDHKPKIIWAPWMRVAASFLMLGLFVAIVYTFILNRAAVEGMIAQMDTVPDTKPGENISLNIPSGLIQEEVISPSQQEPPKVTKPVSRTVHTPPAPSKMVAVTEEQTGIPPKESITQLEIESMDLPPLDTELTIAQSGLSGEEVEEVAYRVTIISNGLRQRQEKDNLVNEIENKINQLGGLLNRVDQEFADLQDAKNGLFASLTSKKENSK